MAYETESIVNQTQAQAPVLQEMREEKTFDPYKYRQGKPMPQPRTPQGSTETGTTPLSPIGQNKDIIEAPEATGQTEETVKLSPQVAALARKEQKYRMEAQALAKEKALIEKEKAEIAELRAMKEKLAAKDYSGLDNLVDYNEYSQYQVNKLNGADPVSDEIKRLSGKVNEIEKSFQDNTSKQFEAAVSERRIATKEIVDNTSDYPRIKKANAHEAVVQHILDTWENDGEELSVAQAAKEVEELLLERAKAWAALAEEEKTEAPIESKEKKTLPPLKEGLKTLTNDMTSGQLRSPRKPLYGLSDSERWAEARRRAEETLQTKRR